MWIVKGLFLLSYLPLRLFSIPFEKMVENIIIKFTKNTFQEILLFLNPWIFNIIILSVMIYYYQITFIMGIIGICIKVILIAIRQFIEYDRKWKKPIDF